MVSQVRVGLPVKGDELYRGKAKTVYLTDDPDHLILHFRDDASAFDGTKKAIFKRKGRVNHRFNAFIMQHLEQAGIATHFVDHYADDAAVVKALDMIPVECVVRNRAAGSLCRRLGIQEGTVLTPPVFEFFYKNDALHDPLINVSHIRTFQWASEKDITQMQAVTMAVNDVLYPLFLAAGMLLVDYKLEFGHHHGSLLLGDEFTPDGCRIWDIETREKLDKDRFREDLGNVIESYERVAERLAI